MEIQVHYQNGKKYGNGGSGASSEPYTLALGISKYGKKRKQGFSGFKDKLSMVFTFNSPQPAIDNEANTPFKGQISSCMLFMNLKEAEHLANKLRYFIEHAKYSKESAVNREFPNMNPKRD